MKKEEEKPKVSFVVEDFYDVKDRFKKLQARMEAARQAAMEKSVHVPHQPPRDPLKKLKRRLDTYHNLRHMRTDYKNYVRLYGEPPFTVPSKISSNYFQAK